MTSRPFRLYGATDSSKVLDHARTTVRAWLERWTAQGVSENTTEVRLLNVAVAPAQNWIHLASDINHQLGIQLEGDWVRALPRIIYGGVCGDSQLNQSGSLEKELFDSMLADLATRFVHQSELTDGLSQTLTTTEISTEVNRPGAGFMMVRVSVTTDHHIWLMMSPQYVEPILEVSDRKVSQSVTVSPVLAIGNRRVTLELAVGTGELTIEELSSLAVGDVIPLDRKLNEEINVCIASDMPFCRGYMGVKQGRVAVQLLSNS